MQKTIRIEANKLAHIHTKNPHIHTCKPTHTYIHTNKLVDSNCSRYGIVG